MLVVFLGSGTIIILRQLLKNETEWLWYVDHDEAFAALKEAVDENMKLRFCDPQKPAKLEVDASMIGLGAALIQENKYANIEHELFVVVFGLERFHTYICGKPVAVYSDHTSLGTIQQEAQLSESPPRLQPYEARMAWRPGLKVLYADYLSRTNPTQGSEIELQPTIHLVQISTNQLPNTNKATNNDPSCQRCESKL